MVVGDPLAGKGHTVPGDDQDGHHEGGDGAGGHDGDYGRGKARVTWSLLTETVMVNIKKMVMLVKVMVMMKTYLQSASELLRELSLIGVVRHQH